MKILIACEYSGKVREAFRKLGHDAWSCDLLPADDNSPYHIQGDVLDILDDGWDMMVAFPPCQHLAVSGARWFKEKIADGRQQQGIDFFMAMVNAPIPMIAIENPIGIMSTRYQKPTHREDGSESRPMEETQRNISRHRRRDGKCLEIKKLSHSIICNSRYTTLIVSIGNDKHNTQQDIDHDNILHRLRKLLWPTR